jgi:hypothetical protein
VTVEPAPSRRDHQQLIPAYGTGQCFQPTDRFYLGRKLPCPSCNVLTCADQASSDVLVGPALALQTAALVCAFQVVLRTRHRPTHCILGLMAITHKVVRAEVCLRKAPGNWQRATACRTRPRDPASSVTGRLRSTLSNIRKGIPLFKGSPALDRLSFW